MHVIPLITIASICAVLLPTYHIYLYRSPGVIPHKMPFKPLWHLFLLSHLDAGAIISVGVVRGHHIYKTVDSTH